MHFHSDESGNYPGFQITYSAVEGLPGCGGTFTSDRGEIHSPGYDGEYPPEVTCEYRIKLPDKSRIKITFLTFSLEEAIDCAADYVEVNQVQIIVSVFKLFLCRFITVLQRIRL